jgi:hypothetical protein
MGKIIKEIEELGARQKSLLRRNDGQPVNLNARM